MDDRGVVTAIRSGDPKGLASAYDTYADRLHAFCWSMLHDHDAAADALHDTFIIASERIGQLRDPDRLRPWLYAIARNECLRQLRAQRRVTVLDEAGDVSDETVSLDARLREEELRSLVWRAADGLNPGERSALELYLRHGLEGRDLADALGVSVSHMNTLLTRARQQLERSLSVILLARSGGKDCAGLAALLAGWDGQLTVLMRKRISRHIDNCDVCGERKRERVSATALLSALPLLAAPFGLRKRILNDIGNTELVAYRRDIARRAGRFNHDGFPVGVDRTRRPAGLRQWGAVAALLAIAAASGTAVWQLSDGNSGNAATTLTQPRQTAPSSPTDLPLAPVGTPSPSPTATPTQSVTPSPTATPLAQPAGNETTTDGRLSSAARPASSSPGTSTATRSPSPSASPTATTAPPAPGTLRVDPASAHLDPDNSTDGSTASHAFTLTAAGGKLTWAAAPDGGDTSLGVSPASGTLAAGGSQSVTISVDRNEQSGKGSVTFTNSSTGQQVTVTVTWDPFVIVS